MLLPDQLAYFILVTSNRPCCAA